MRWKAILATLGFMVAFTITFSVAAANPYMVIVRESNLVDKKVIAFYYPWYSNATNYTRSAPYPVVDDTAWRHWNGSTLNTPLMGAYDSADPATIEQHLRDAEWAGIDALVWSYWGASGYEFTNFKNALGVARAINSNVSFTVYFEIFMNDMESKSISEASTFISNELAAIHAVFTDPANEPLIWHELGKPVLFVYVVQAVPAAVWANVMANVSASGANFFMVADRPGGSIDYNKHFQATHQYDVYYPSYHGTYFETYMRMKMDAARFGQLFIAGVSPGYDDHLVRPGNPPLPRNGNATYRQSWCNAISLHPDWIAITSWNEWHEGTEIEPSVENGRAALEQTRAYAAEFKSGTYQQLQAVDFYTPMIANAIWMAVVSWVVFAAACFLPALARKSEHYGLRFAFGLLLVVMAWVGVFAFGAWEIVLGNNLAIMGAWYVFIAPVLCGFHAIGTWLLQSRPDGPRQRERR
ncbi:MAG: hypothetical protein GYA24_22425 [Candidatus Lokiarchaeota archaeon]|nr:hypothetical protein [Candidatus Lokiarchaeota archaeon]